MPDYRVLGGVFRSSIALPGLSTTRGAPDRTFERVDQLPPVGPLEQIGRESAGADADVALFRHPEGFRLVFDDTGSFDVSRGGRTIRWCPAGPGVDLDLVRKDVLGRALAVALHSEGVLALHGGAVAFPQHAVAFVGPKGHGKSTTVSALVRAGGALLADDLVAVDLRPETPAVLPGHPVVLLRRDSAEAASPPDAPLAADAAGLKYALHLDPGERATSPAPLAALYLLSPTADTDAPIRRLPIEGQVGALTIAGHTKIGALLDGRERSVQLDQACALGERVGIHRLEVPRTFDRLPELVETLLAWHAPELLA